MKYLTLFFLSAVLWCCSSKSNQSESLAYAEETEEVTEEAAEEVEAYEMEAAEPDESYYRLAELDCKQGQSIILKNFYQLAPADAEQLDQESTFYGSILDLRYRMDAIIQMCLGTNSNSPDQYERFFNSNIEERGNQTRSDLIPEMDRRMTVVPNYLVDFAKDNLIPNPNAVQYNGITYRRLYDYYKNEFRNLHFAYLLFKHHSSIEYEMRLYANAASSDYQVFNSFLNRYREPFWKSVSGIELSSQTHNYSAFWMRRALDGSINHLVAMQEKVIDLYDPAWKGEVQEMFGPAKPTIRFDTTFYDKSIPSGLIETSRDSIDKFFEQAENGILIKFDNGQSRFYNQGEYEGYYIDGYLPKNHALILRYQSEYPDSFYLDLATGKQSVMGSEVNEVFASPDGQFIIEKYIGMNTSGLRIFQVQGDAVQFLFNSGYLLNSAAPKWINNKKFSLPLEMKGSLTVDLGIY